MLTGVVEVGLFCHMAKAVYFGNEVRLSPLTLSHLRHPPHHFISLLSLIPLLSLIVPSPLIAPLNTHA